MWNHYKFVSYKNTEPFKQTGFIMKVMDVEHILADKTLLIAKKFLYLSGSLDWMTKRTQGRHAYDLQRCLEEGYKLKEEHLITLIKKEIVKLEEPFVRGNDPKPTNLINMIKRKDLFEAFKYEYSLIEEQIKTAIEQIVYPSHERYSSSKMLRLYKKEFNEIITLIKKEFSNPKNKKAI